MALTRRPTAREPLNPPPEDDECGPAMLELTPAARAFVIAWLQFGGSHKKATQAAIIAGIGGNERSSEVWASRAMRNPKILAALREEAEKRTQAGGLIGASALIEIAEDMQHKDRFKAAVELLNRSGLIVATINKIQHEIVDKRSTKDLAASIDERLKRLGVMKDGEGQIIEAEYEVVGSSEGLEDLLAPAGETANV